MRVRFATEVPNPVRTLVRLVIHDYYRAAVTFDLATSRCEARTLEKIVQSCVATFGERHLAVVWGHLSVSRERQGSTHPRMDVNSSSYNELPFSSQVVLEVVWYLYKRFPQVVTDSQRRVKLAEFVNRMERLADRSRIPWEEVVAAMTDIAPTVLGSSWKRK